MQTIEALMLKNYECEQRISSLSVQRDQMLEQKALLFNQNIDFLKMAKVALAQLQHAAEAQCQNTTCLQFIEFFAETALLPKVVDFVAQSVHVSTVTHEFLLLCVELLTESFLHEEVVQCVWIEKPNALNHFFGAFSVFLMKIEIAQCNLYLSLAILQLLKNLW